MKRIQLKQTKDQDNFLLADGFPDDLTDYITRLKLLYGVPFSYLIADENALPEESLRFFYVDSNWTEILAKGALSVGRVSTGEAAHDQAQMSVSSPKADCRLRTVRFKKMHENHRRAQMAPDARFAPDVLTGFILRSVLTRRMKGLEVTGSSNGRALDILRMEALSDDVLICIFDGEVTDLVIAEPKVGLRFGSPDNTRIIRVRAVSDDQSFGKYLDQTIDLNHFTESNGKLNISGFARRLESILDTKIGSAQVAFELIATAHRAEFIKK